MKKLFLLLLAVMTLSLCASAQTRVVRGTVLDAENNEPLIGVSVTAGTGYGAATDINGQFVVTVPASATQLNVSYVGYEPQTVTISSSDLTIHLQPANSLLDPVIVVAYGQQKRSSFTGSAAVVGSATIEKTQVTNVLDALNGKVAGLQMSNASGAPGASNPTIRVRGFSSILAGNEPLIIVDGTPYTGDINSLNTNDIESMSVLKDAASNALYGARGANGVILITTKRARLGEATVTFDAKWGGQSRASQDYDYVTDPRQYYELYYKSLYNYATAPQDMYSANGGEYLNIGGMGMSNAAATEWANNQLIDGAFGLKYNVFTVPEGQFMIGYNGKFNPNATEGRMVNYNGQDFWLQPDNWMDEVYRTSLRHEYNLSVTQGTEKSNFMASFNYLNNDGIINAPSNFERLTGRLSADVQAKSWLKVGANVSYSHVNTEVMDGNAEGASNNSGNIFAFATQVAPIYPLYMRNGKRQIMIDRNGITRYDYGGGLNAGLKRPFLTGTNGVSDTMLNKNSQSINTVTATGFIEIRFLKDFKFTSNNNINLQEYRLTSTSNPFYGQFAPTGGSVYKQHSRAVDYTIQQLLNWNHTYANVHNVSVLLGHEWYKQTVEHLYGSRDNIFLPENTELSGAIIDKSPGSYSTMYNNEGWLGRAQYDYDGKYFISASFRRDASSRFHPKHRWGNFWSAGAAWIISKEEFFNVDWIDMLKIKASYGEQGNDNIGNYRYVDTYSLVNSNGSPAVNPASKGNEMITWEKGGNFNAGFEFDVLNTRLNGQVEFFYRKTSDMLMSFPLPASSGFMGYYSNVGDMTNTGVEIELTGDVIRTKDFRWTLNGNLTWYKNRISKLPDERKGQTIDGVSGFSSGDVFYGEGIAMYSYKMPRYAGVNPENGMAMYYKKVLDADGNETGELITTHDYGQASDFICGTALAPVYGGFGTSFEYKDFDLSIAFNYQIGGQVYDSAYSSMMSSPVSSASGTNLHADLYKAWTPQNPNTNIPRFQATDQYTTAKSDRFMVNASYLSLDNINFGYTLPNKIVKKAHLNKVRVYFAADNIWVWSRRQGLDPRQSFTGTPNNNYYAPIRTLSGGITVSF